MKVYAQKQNQPQQQSSSNISRSSARSLTTSHAIQPTLHLQHMIGNQSVLRSPHNNTEGLKVSSETPEITRFAHDFSRIPVHSKSPVSLQAEPWVDNLGVAHNQQSGHVAKCLNEVTEQLRIQKKSVDISSPTDAEEIEADEVARKVVEGQSAEIHGLSRTVNRNGAGLADTTPEFTSNLASSKGGGQSLDETIRSEMELKMRADFNRVRVHTDGRANGMSQSINAKAFTYGNDIYFKQGQYNPRSRQGIELLAHELVHTKQRARLGRGLSYINRQATEDRGDNPDLKKVYNKYKTKPYTVDTYDKDWHIYVQEKPGIKKAFEEEGTRVGVAPSELFTIAMGEGLGIFFDEGQGENTEVSGFVYLGTDHFSSESNRYTKYLPTDFNKGDEFREISHTNEKKQPVKSAMFKNLRVALTGFAAVYKYHRQLAINYGTELKYGQPTPEQLHFWSYYFFQSPNGAKPILQKNSSWDYSKKEFDKNSPHPSDIASKCYKRVATWQYIKSKRVFSN